MFTAALFTTAKIWKQHVYTSTIEYYATMNKMETLPFATAGMDLDDNMLSEISQT